MFFPGLTLISKWNDIGVEQLISVSDALVWKERDANSVMIFPIKKRINTELFNDRAPPLYKVDDWFKNKFTVVNHFVRIDHCAPKDVPMRNQASSLFWND